MVTTMKKTATKKRQVKSASAKTTTSVKVKTSVKAKSPVKAKTSVKAKSSVKESTSVRTTTKAPISRVKAYVTPEDSKAEKANEPENRLAEAAPAKKSLTPTRADDRSVENILAGDGAVSADDVVDEVMTPQKKRRERRSEMAALEWARYQRTGDPETRRRLLALYLPLVRSVAGRMAMGFPRSVDIQDLINTGVLGLSEAFKKFDPERGVKFETYAVPRIRGAILDELRALDWVPRSTRAKARNIDRATVSLENDHGRPPTEDELAAHLECTHGELMHAIGDASNATILSLDEVIFRDEENRQVPRIESVEDPADTSVLKQVLKEEMRTFLKVAISNLTDQEKLVIALYYFEELTLKEIGAVMKISESRVSQIHTKGVGKLRGLIQERYDGPVE